MVEEGASVKAFCAAAGAEVPIRKLQTSICHYSHISPYPVRGIGVREAGRIPPTNKGQQRGWSIKPLGAPAVSALLTQRDWGVRQVSQPNG